MGFAHNLFLIWFPVPHFFEQGDHSPKSVHAPFTGHPCGLHSWVTVEFPSQSFPPFSGIGFVQNLFLVWVPVSHFFEHTDHSSKSVHPPFTGHPCALHSWVSLESPSQNFPPFSGIGFVHDLVLVWAPEPQFFEQLDQSLNSVQPPSAEKKYQYGVHVEKKSN